LGSNGWTFNTCQYFDLENPAFRAAPTAGNFPYDILLINRIVELVKLNPRSPTQTHLFDTLLGVFKRREASDEDVVTLPADREELVHLVLIAWDGFTCIFVNLDRGALGNFGVVKLGSSFIFKF
jgi:hypothetical protein